MLIRRVEPEDMDEFVELCSAHAAFERSSSRAPNKDRLSTALFGAPPRIHAWVAVTNAGALCGYASATVDFSTWSAGDFLHLDCLFVRSDHRNQKIGEALLLAVREYARSCGIQELQWQTPDWNTAAQRFYERMHAQPHRKVRYVLRLQ